MSPARPAHPSDESDRHRPPRASGAGAPVGGASEGGADPDPAPDPAPGPEAASRPGALPRGVRKAATQVGHAGLGLQFALTLVLFALAGLWLDSKFGSSPWLLLLGVLLGGGGGMISLFRRLPIQAKSRPRDPGGPS